MDTSRAKDQVDYVMKKLFSAFVMLVGALGSGSSALAAQFPLATRLHVRPTVPSPLIGAWWEECEGRHPVCGKWRVAAKAGNQARLVGGWTNGARGMLHLTVSGNRVRLTRLDGKMDPGLTAVYTGTVSHYRASGKVVFYVPGRKAPIDRGLWSANIHVAMMGFSQHLPKGYL